MSAASSSGIQRTAFCLAAGGFAGQVRSGRKVEVLRGVGGADHRLAGQQEPDVARSPPGSSRASLAAAAAPSAVSLA
jgi:hypothetical protein